MWTAKHNRSLPLQRPSIRVAWAGVLLCLGVAALGGEPESVEGDSVSGGVVRDARIEIHKGDRTLSLFSGETLLETYDIGLGFQPTGSKTQEGDGATPEGEYVVCVKNPWSRYFLSLGLNYPNADDAARGLEGGLITAAEQEAIVRAERRGICPPWNTRLGGEIFIHGHGAEDDWTLGCIALENPDMKRLFDAVRIGTRVEIRP